MINHGLNWFNYVIKSDIFMILPQPRTFLRGYPGVIPHFDYYNRSALIEATRYFPLSSSISCSPSTVVVVTHLCVCVDHMV